METAAVELIIENVRAGIYKLYYSPVHEAEIGAIKDDYEANELMDFLRQWGKNAEKQVISGDTRNRAEDFVLKGFGPGDAAHAAFAEAIRAMFITCDDQLIKQCKRNEILVWCGTPVEFCEMEGLQ